MKTITLISLLLLTPALAAAGPKDEAPIGIGGGSTVGGTSGVMLEKYLSETTGIQVGLGMNLGSGDVGLGLGAYGLYRLIGDERGSGNLVYGFDVRLRTNGGLGADFGPAIGIQGDVFVTPGLSVWAQTGVTAWVLGKNTVASGNADHGDIIGE